MGVGRGRTHTTPDHTTPHPCTPRSPFPPFSRPAPQEAAKVFSGLNLGSGEGGGGGGGGAPDPSDPAYKVRVGVWAREWTWACV